MPGTLSRLACSCLTWLLLAQLCAAQGPARRADEYVRYEAGRSHFSGSVLVARGGRVLLAAGYGMEDRERGVPNTTRTKFRLGSLTKQFTAMAVMMLRERGRLGLQDPVCDYLPRCPAAWRPITIHHLLTHTSGLADADYTEAIVLPMSAEHTVEHLGAKPLLFKPGQAFRYSNANYILLGHIIEKASGLPYGRFIRENIFRPLGMRDSGYGDPPPALRHRARGYSFRGGRVVDAARVDMSIPFSAGGLYSTAEDLYRWDQALYAGRLVSGESLAAVFTPYRGTYGYGWYVAELYGRRYVNHGGWIDGFAAALARLPGPRLTVIVLSNQDSAPVNTMARRLAGLMLGVRLEPLEEPRAVGVEAQRLDAYVGQYELAPNFVITVTREGGRLMGQATGRPKLELIPAAKGRFFVKEFDAQITFVRDGGGLVSHSIVSLNGREARAEKIK